MTLSGVCSEQSQGPVSDDAPEAGLARGRGLVLVLLSVYIVGLALLAASGHFAIFPKEVLVPVLLLPAAVSGRLRSFVFDWVLFIALLALFDALRGFIFCAIACLDLPVYMMYAVQAERVLLGGEILPVLMQNAFPDGLGAFDNLLVVVHGSHFAAFLGFGLFLWYWRREAFPRFRAAMLLVCYVGLVAYLLVPTVPPWMADYLFYAVPPVERPIMTAYNTYIPVITAGLDINAIAAMPSLHAAIPTLLSFVAVHHFRMRALPIIAYTALVYFAITYGGEHYLVDVLAGVLLAALSYGLVYHTFRFRKVGAAVAKSAVSGLSPLQQRLVLSALLALTIVLLAKASDEIAQPWEPGEEFARRELVGHSPVAGFYLGRAAFKRADFEQAVRLLGSLPRQFHTQESVRMLATSYLETGRDTEAVRLLDENVNANPELISRLFWRALILSRYGKISMAELEQVIATLEERAGDTGHMMADRLRRARGDTLPRGPVAGRIYLRMGPES